ncbi:MAG: VPLPA-CTERM sorting domain-containing protein [Phycisphaerales bacterium]
MTRISAKGAIFGCAIATGIAGAAQANTLYTFEWDSINAGNNAAGNFESITASYNDMTEQFTWSVTFSDQVTDGFTLAVNDGPNPKNHPGELALLYFDASDTNDIGLTAYGYNGENDLSSFTDGDPDSPGNQTPDFIAGNQGSSDGSWINSLSVVDFAGKRTMSFDIDASIINSHDPAFDGGDPSTVWTGLAFGEKIGFWFHSMTGLDAAYDADGKLTEWDRANEGWLDIANRTNGISMLVVPLPPAAWAGLVGLVGVAAARRRFGR